MESRETMEECENPPLSEGLKLGVSSGCQNIIILEVRCVCVLGRKLPRHNTQHLHPVLKFVPHNQKKEKKEKKF